MIKGYHINNGIFSDSDFMEELFKKQQNIRFIGASASHKNGASERATNMEVTMARTMLIHTEIICTDDTLSTDICPTTIYSAVWVYNSIPDMQFGLSAIEIW